MDRRYDLLRVLAAVLLGERFRRDDLPCAVAYWCRIGDVLCDYVSCSCEIADAEERCAVEVDSELLTDLYYSMIGFYRPSMQTWRLLTYIFMLDRLYATVIFFT